MARPCTYEQTDCLPRERTDEKKNSDTAASWRREKMNKEMAVYHRKKDEKIKTSSGESGENVLPYSLSGDDTDLELEMKEKH